MSLESKGGPESIAAVVQRIKAWVTLQTPGIVRIRYVSDVSRDLAIQELSQVSAATIRFEPPEAGHASEWLEDRLKALETIDDSAIRAVCVVFPFQSEALRVSRFWPALHTLNLKRESISRLQLIQLWWIDETLADQAELEAPDLSSWFQLRLKLKETPPVEEAVSFYRQLALGRPESFLPDLAESLNQYGNELGKEGRLEDAQARAHEAVAIFRHLAQKRPDAFLPNLAGSLNDLANRLSSLGRREEAVSAAEEAVRLYRQLAEQRPEDFQSYLAMSLNTLANRLSGMGRFEDALTSVEEAVKLFGQLAQQRPHAFLPFMAGSLNNLAGRLSELGRREETLPAAEIAVKIYRQLAELDPDAFLPDLAGSLNTLGNGLGALGRLEEATAVAEEAVKFHRQLAQQRPEAFLPALAMSLNNFANRLNERGRNEEAIAVIKEAIILYGQLIQKHPDPFLPQLAKSQAALGNILLADEPVDATKQFEKGIRVLSPLFLRSPQAHGPLMKLMIGLYTRTAERAQIETDRELLTPIVKELHILGLLKARA